LIFKYSGYDKNGKKIKSKIEAIDIVEVKTKLRSKGIIYTYILQDSKSIFQSINFRRKNNISYFELSTISRDLSIYIKSGISIVNAIKLASNQYKANKKHSLFFKSIESFLNEGKNFYQAVETQNVYNLPAFYKQSIKVSENSGILGQVLLELSIFLKEQDKINKQIKNALAYPLFIFFISIFVVIFMMSYIVPKITSIFSELHQKMPKITQFVINSGQFFSKNWIYMFVILLITYIVYFSLKKVNRGFSKFIDEIKLKIPIIGKIIYKNEMGRFAYVSHILMKSGVPFAKTINLSTKILDNLYLKDIFKEASKKVVEGDKLSNALYKVDKNMDKSFMQAISLGEETSQTMQILENLSQLYFEENRDKTTMLLALLEPALMLFVGTLVGFIITAMLLPIFSINIGT
jgi:general secretion pathway protein F/type IV pilus assembly protein PilC